MIKKNEIKGNDILYFKNGSNKVFYETERWVLNEFYDNELKCRENDGLDIVNVKRPYYFDMAVDYNDVHNMDRLALETEVVELRMQVSNLKSDIIRKDETIRIYGNYIDDINTKLHKKARASKKLVKE